MRSKNTPSPAPLRSLNDSRHPSALAPCGSDIAPEREVLRPAASGHERHGALLDYEIEMPVSRAKLAPKPRHNYEFSVDASMPCQRGMCTEFAVMNAGSFCRSKGSA
jgi:hypothetical protein